MHSIWTAYLIYQKIVFWESKHRKHPNNRSVLIRFLENNHPKLHFIVIIGTVSSSAWCYVMGWYAGLWMPIEIITEAQSPVADALVQRVLDMTSAGLAGSLLVMIIISHLYILEGNSCFKVWNGNWEKIHDLC